MDRKSRILRLIEVYVNELKKEDVELFYGSGSKIKLLNIDYITSNKKLYIDFCVVFGDEFDITYLDGNMACFLIDESLIYLFPDMRANYNFTFDV